MSEHEHVEKHMASLGDAELLAVVEGPSGEYEPFALEIARAELARRRISPGDLPRLREQAATEANAAAPPSASQAAAAYVEHYFTPILAVTEAAETSESFQMTPEQRGVATRGTRVAGAILIVNALLSILDLAFSKAPAAGSNPIAGVIVDAFVGWALLSGQPKGRYIGIARITLGALVWGLMAAMQRNFYGMGAQLVFSTALALLIAGNPGMPRFALASVMAGACLLLASVGVIAEATTADWYLRDAVAARKDNELSDRWLVRPDLDAHVLIIGEELGGEVSQPRFERALADDAKARLADFKMFEREALPGGGVLHYSGKAQALSLEYYRATFADGNRAFQVIAFATPEHFAKARTDLSSIVRSFQPRCATTSK